MALSFQNRDHALMIGETNQEEIQETAMLSQDTWVTTALVMSSFPGNRTLSDGSANGGC